VSSARARGVVLLVVVFIGGAGAGFWFARIRTIASAPPNPMEPHAFVQRLDSTLALDGAQRDSIVAILTRRQNIIDSAWRVLRPNVRATIDSAQREIVSVLRPDQRPRYMELLRAAHGTMPPR
jgi:hypothetical protein